VRDLNKVLDQLLQNNAAKGFAGGLLAGALLGKPGHKLAKKTVKYGGMAAIAALAYTAYKRYNENRGLGGGTARPATLATELLPAPANSNFLPAESDTAAREALGLALVRAMIAAARADGKFDAKESQAIFDRIQSANLDPEEKALLLEEMNHPADMDAIVRAAKTPECAAELYTASLLAIDVDHPAENAYLAMLAARLKLPPELTAELQRQVSAE
jgi:uncharacterized membrane protein YebE (DUF533 family)